MERCCSQRPRQPHELCDHGFPLALEIIVRGEDGHNGMKSQLSKLCERFDAFEKKAIRWIAVGTSLPGIVVAVVAVLRFLGKT